MPTSRTKLLALLLFCLLLPACQSNKAGKAFELHKAGDYPGALREAQTVLAQATDQEARDRANLVAGMAAYELRRYDEAERYLAPATRAADQQTAGRAYATRGLVGVRRDRYSTAALDLMSAGRRLTADDAAQAHYFAGECYTLMGDLDRARGAYTRALAAAETPALRERISSRLSSSDYTLQLGVFSNRANADNLLKLAGKRAAERSLPAPSVTQSTDVAGRTVHLVTLGQFKQRTEAVAARTRLGMDAVVVPMRK